MVRQIFAFITIYEIFPIGEIEVMKRRVYVLRKANIMPQDDTRGACQYKDVVLPV